MFPMVGKDPQVLQPALCEPLPPEFLILDPSDHRDIIFRFYLHVIVYRVPLVAGKEPKSVGPVLLLVVHRPHNPPDLPMIWEKRGIAAVIGDM